MARPSLPIGTYGAISHSEVTPGRFRARTRFRDFDGSIRQVEAHGRSRAAAERALKLALRDRTAPAGWEVTPEMRISTLGELWFAELETEGRLRPQSIDTYRLVWVKHVEPAVGQLRVREVTVSRVDRAVRAIGGAAPGQVRHARVVLAGILGLAIRHDTLGSNPVRSIARTPASRKVVTAVDVELLEAVRRAVREHRTERDDEGRLPPGPRPTSTLPDVIDILLATGARIGEVLALRWRDVDLKPDRPTLTISATVVAVKGEGLVRQAMPKTAAGRRTIVLPRFAIDVLLRRRVEAAGSNPHDAVFPSARGTWLAPRNVARQWRAVRTEAGLEHVTLHGFRRTVATLIDFELRTKQAAAQLGHSSEAVTTAFYVQKPAIAPDSSETLQRLGPQ